MSATNERRALEGGAGRQTHLPRLWKGRSYRFKRRTASGLRAFGLGVKAE